MALRIRRGPTADRTSVTFLEGEIVYDTDQHVVYVGDGTTAGGLPVSTYTNNNAKDAVGTMFQDGTHSNISFSYDDVAKTITATVTLDGVGIQNVVEDTTPQLGGDLDLNSNGVTGVGTINITGSITGAGLFGDLTGDVTGSVKSGDGLVVVLNHGTDGSDAVFTGSVIGNVDGNVSGDLTGSILSGDGLVVVLNHGTDGSDAVFTGAVTGSITTSSITAVGSTVNVNSDTVITGTVAATGDVSGSTITSNGLLSATVTDPSGFNFEPDVLTLKAFCSGTLSSGPVINFEVESAGDGLFNPAKVVAYRDTDDVGVFEIRTQAINNGGMTPILSCSSENGIQTLTTLIAGYGINVPERPDAAGGLPISSIGTANDFAGSVRFGAISGTYYLFYCTADYDGVTDIWVRVALDATPW